MSLRAKAVLLLVILTAVYAMITITVQFLGVSPEFEKLEREQAAKDMLRCSHALEHELERLAAAAADWAFWDDTYAFVAAPNARYLKSNLSQTSFTELRVSLISIHDLRGDLVAGGAYDWRSGQPLDLDDTFHVRLKAALSGAQEQRPMAGICLTDEGPLLLAVSPVKDSYKRNPSRGWLVMGLKVDDLLMEELRHQVQVNFRLTPIETSPAMLPRPDPPVVPATPELFVENVSSALKRAHMIRPDLLGQGSFVLSADIPREITAVSGSALRMAIGGDFLAGLFALVCLWLFLDQTVLRPVGEIRRHMTGVRQDGDLSRRLPERRGDEVGMLAREYNAMLDRLGDSRHEILRQTFRLGMAEMASEVLHNVRNAFSPLKAGLFMLHERLTRETAHAAGAIVPASPGGERLAQALHGAERKIAEVYDQALVLEKDLDSLQRFSLGARSTEPLALRSMLADAFLFVPDPLRRGLELKVDPALASMPPVTANRVTLLEVISNVLINSAQAYGAAGGAIHAAAWREEHEGRGFVHLSLADDGSGMPSGELARIFQRGYTSAKERRLGLGLHWCSNAMSEMGGRIWAESPGPGQGFTAHILLRAGQHTHAT